MMPDLPKMPSISTLKTIDAYIKASEALHSSIRDHVEHQTKARQERFAKLEASRGITKKMG